jgi:hypothetical protein
MGPSSLSLALAPVAQAARRSGKAGRTCNPRMLLSLQPA